MRGYKVDSQGRKTTFFNNELDDKTKALIGDIAPKKVAALDADEGRRRGFFVEPSWHLRVQRSHEVDAGVVGIQVPRFYGRFAREEGRGLDGAVLPHGQKDQRYKRRRVDGAS